MNNKRFGYHAVTLTGVRQEGGEIELDWAGFGLVSAVERS